MPDVTIIKLKIRRGTDAQRANVVLEQGELGYTTDTRRVFVGDGISMGGIPVSNIFHAPIDNPNNLIYERNAVLNDIVYAGRSIYQLTQGGYSSLENWTKIGGNVYADNNTIEFFDVGQEQTLRLKNNSVDSNKFASTAAFSQGGLVATAGSGLSANVDNVTININPDNQLAVKDIDENTILNTSFDRGINGGDGLKIGLNIDQDYLGFSSNTLTITALPPNIVKYDTIDPTVFGNGIVQDGGVFSTTVIDSDGVTITNNSGTLSLPTIIGAGNSFFKTLSFADTGLINGSEYTVSSTLCCADPTFGGIPDQISTNLEYFGQSQIVTRDPITTNIVTLTSAGFITFESTGSRNGTSVDRFAIPVFTY